MLVPRFLPDEAATAELGQDLAHALRPGDVLALRGELGVGKTTLARGLIRTLANDPGLDVPSPTFTMVQPYAGRPPVSHFDLYRLGSPDELEELGLSEALAEGVAVIEWPELAGARLPGTTMTVSLKEERAGRLASFSGPDPALARVGRSLAARDFLRQSGWEAAHRAPFAGDASARSYELVTKLGKTPVLLMNSPPLVLGLPVRDGKPYAEIAHTARSVHAFVAIDEALRQSGLCAPRILARDLDRGFLIVEHLGEGGMLDRDGRPIAGRYAAAAEWLAEMHGRRWASRMEAKGGKVYVVPPFDRDAMQIEADLLIEWYWPFVSGKPASERLRTDFRAAWRPILERLAQAEQSLVLRDFHSPNLIWREDRIGSDRLGVIDFQDALIGPAAYDVASLAMDARVTIPPALERATVSAYATARAKAGPFDREAFARAYAMAAAQRNSKILGIFIRLDKRDGKPQYLAHLPRIRDYLARALAHPALADLAVFYRQHGLTAGDVA